MKISRVATIITAGLSSAVSFYVLTRSGLAGTLGGAAVAGVVYNLTSLGLNHGLDRSSRMIKRVQETEAGGTGAGGGDTGNGAALTRDDAGTVPEEARASGPANRNPIETAIRWLPAVLGAAALVLSIWAVVDGGETSVIHERVVEHRAATDGREEAQIPDDRSGAAQPPGTQGGDTSSATEGQTSTTVPSTTASSTTTNHSSSTTSAEPTDSTSTTVSGDVQENPQDPGTSLEGSTSQVQNR